MLPVKPEGALTVPPSVGQAISEEPIVTVN